MSQSKKMSFVEQLISTAFGFAISLCIQFYLMIFMGKEFSHAENVFVISVYTVASIARGYGVRRFFNWWHIRESGEGKNKIFDMTDFEDAIDCRDRIRTSAKRVLSKLTIDNIEVQSEKIQRIIPKSRGFKYIFLDEIDKFVDEEKPNALIKMASIENTKLYPKKLWNEKSQQWDDNPAYYKQLELESQK